MSKKEKFKELLEKAYEKWRRGVFREEIERVQYLLDLLSKLEKSEFTRADPKFHEMVKEKIKFLKKKLKELM